MSHQSLWGISWDFGFLQAIETADFSPNLRWIPMDLPFALKQLLEYIFAVSAALALLNMAPIFGLDGKAALESLIDIFSIESNDLSRGRGRCSWQRSAVLVQNSLICLGSVVFCFILTVNIARVAGYDTALIRLVVLVRHVLTFSLRFGWQTSRLILSEDSHQLNTVST